MARLPKKPKVARVKQMDARDLFVVEDEKVQRVFGVIAGERAFIFPKHARHGGSARTARIYWAKYVFRTADAAADSMKQQSGWTWVYRRHDYRLTRCRVIRNAMGELIGVTKDGSRIHHRFGDKNTEAWLTKKGAKLARARTVRLDIKANLADMNDTRKKIQKMQKQLVDLNRG